MPQEQVSWLAHTCGSSAWLTSFIRNFLTGITLDCLPEEILLHIWTHLEEPQAWAQTSKRFRARSQVVFWRAKWFKQRYELYLVIFEAIARPTLFTVALFEQLLRLGAPLSRNLVQLLQIVREPTLVAQLHENDSDWGHISLPAYAAVVERAELQVRTESPHERGSLTSLTLQARSMTRIHSRSTATSSPSRFKIARATLTGVSNCVLSIHIMSLMPITVASFDRLARTGSSQPADPTDVLGRLPAAANRASV